MSLERQNVAVPTRAEPASPRPTAAAAETPARDATGEATMIRHKSLPGSHPAGFARRRSVMIRSKATARTTANSEQPSTSRFGLDSRPLYYQTTAITLPNPAMEGGWCCSNEGVLDIFQGLDLGTVDHPVRLADVTLYRSVNEQARNLPRHILKWGESKNGDIVVWSVQESCATRTANRKIHVAVPSNRRRGMRAKVCNIMRDMASGKGQGSAMAKMFAVTKVKEDAHEVIWHLARRREAIAPVVTQD
ncbi:hypothetical protein AK830_g9078 [Neonectria ditissima]|uniref:Uncharacterized protein n=1 Tax=Neonectria ditissima TaxID=78410 RepID=A0A0P7B6E8_9HYPO|nr:hypothetical protein AK830_g9078 [Neonectria ditissima]